MINTAKAVASLRPNVEWTMTDNDVQGITWHTEGVEPLTTKQVQAEIKRLESEAIAQAAAATLSSVSAGSVGTFVSGVAGRIAGGGTQ